MESAILRTVLYADVFDFPLTLQELHRYLICSQPVALSEIEKALRCSPRLQTLLCQQDAYIALTARSHIIDKRHQRQQFAAPLAAQSFAYGRLLAALPFVRMVAVTGAVAMHNPSHAADDIDYMLVVQTGRVWLARAMCVALVRLARLRGVELCPNYVLSVDQLPQQRVDLYVAHELAQMLPLYGHEVYHALLAANPWVETYLPNSQIQSLAAAAPCQRMKQWAEYGLGSWLGDHLEVWEFRRKSARFQQQATQRQASAVIDANTIKGHFRDHGQRILDEYNERLVTYNVPPL